MNPLDKLKANLPDGKVIELYSSPLAKMMNAVAESPKLLDMAITKQMGQFLDRKLDPTWEALKSTATWLSMSMNLTEANRDRYHARWNEIYNLLQETDNAPTTNSADATPAPATEAPAPEVAAEPATKAEG
jgi:hypothetical protein